MGVLHFFSVFIVGNLMTLPKTRNKPMYTIVHNWPKELEKLGGVLALGDPIILRLTRLSMCANFFEQSTIVTITVGVFHYSARLSHRVCVTPNGIYARHKSIAHTVYLIAACPQYAVTITPVSIGTSEYKSYRIALLMNDESYIPNAYHVSRKVASNSFKSNFLVSFWW